MASPALHALLSASSSDRWMNCPGSIQLSQGMPNEESVYAREGSAAHKLAAMCLEEEDDPDNWLKEEVPGFEEFIVDEEMADAIHVYMDAISQVLKLYHSEGYFDEEILYEYRFDLTHIHPDMGGTADCVIYFPAWKKLFVFDFKYGKGIAVEVEENSQLTYYGLGALSGKHNRPIDQIELVIVQPRCSHRDGPIRSWTLDVEALLNFTADIIEAAAKTKAKKPIFKAGEWCRFCPAAAVCKTLETRAFELACAEFDTEGVITVPNPNDMSPKELKLAWQNAQIIEGFAKSVKAYAHTQALAGNLLPDTKLVNGKAHRRWKSKELAEEKLEEMMGIGLIDGEIKTSKLKTPKQIEDMCGSKYKKIIQELWEKGTGKLSLVPIDDPRPPAKVDALEEFEALN